ncbi:threonine synthase [Sulfolobales archaeon HS-7]|nr:threonine synthase [Sulfolobales archaeon HS-7]
MDVCMRCGTPRKGLELLCKRCGGPFKKVVDFPYDKQVRKNFPYIKRWVTLGELNTPVVSHGNLYFKLDSLNPTGSYKDRGAVTLISFLAEKGINEISEDSSGNAGASIAAYGAAAGMRVKIYVPERSAGIKVEQIEAYGAKVIKVKGTRNDVADAAMKDGAFYASHVLNPEFRDGIRTLSYEIASLRDVKNVFIPISAGTLLLGVYEGFMHLLNSGIVSEVPKLIGVQTKQVSPVCSKLKGINYTPPTQVTSIADALVSTSPVLLEEMVQVLRNYGDCVIVDEDEIKRAWEELAKMGILAEYSSAVSYAGYKKVIPEEKSVIHISGNGLKNLFPA